MARGRHRTGWRDGGYAALLCALLAGPAVAGGTGYTVRGEDCTDAIRGLRGRAPAVALDGRRHLMLIRPGAEAFVDEALARRPVYEHLVELRLGATSVLLDPEAEYGRQGVGVLDENHHLLVAQRLWRKLNAGGPYTIRGLEGPAEPEANAMIVPRAVILKEDLTPPQRRMPTVPAPAPARAREHVAATW